MEILPPQTLKSVRVSDMIGQTRLTRGVPGRDSEPWGREGCRATSLGALRKAGASYHQASVTRAGVFAGHCPRARKYSKREDLPGKLLHTCPSSKQSSQRQVSEEIVTEAEGRRENVC